MLIEVTKIHNKPLDNIRSSSSLRNKNKYHNEYSTRPQTQAKGSLRRYRSYKVFSKSRSGVNNLSEQRIRKLL